MADAEDASAFPDRRAALSPIQFAVTQEAGTEPAFSGAYWDHHGDGLYRCVVCETPLFDSSTKFESGTGWPSFSDVLANDRLELIDDQAYGMRRTEARCKTCGAHLGHLFPDGPRPTGLRYCINSAALEFAPREEQATSGARVLAPRAKPGERGLEPRDDVAQRERADHLREEIRDLREGHAPAADQESTGGLLSPRDFIERKQRDLTGL